MIKGFPSLEQNDRMKAFGHASVSPLREKQHALEVTASVYAERVGTDVAEVYTAAAGDPTDVKLWKLKATAHAMRRGDIVRFTAGALAAYEIKVWRVIDANHVELAENLVAVPDTLAFTILRPRAPELDPVTGGVLASFSYLDVVDLIDGGVFDASTITAAGGGTFRTIVAVLAANVKKIQVMSTSGLMIGLYTGAAAAETLKAVIGPGADYEIQAQILAGTRLSVQSMDAQVGAASELLAMNFLG